MSFIISTDAAADLGLGYIAQNDVKILSMKYLMGNDEYSFGNGEGLSFPEFYEKIRSGTLAKTMLANVDKHIEHFTPLLKTGNNILHVSLSSGLSGTANCAKQAAESLKAEFPNNNVVVIDALGASMGQGLFVDYLVRMRAEGKTLEEAVAWGEANILHLCHFFTVDDLGHLRRGGRVSGFSSFVGSILKIKPLLHVNNEGKLIPIRKIMGRTKALHSLVDMMEERAADKNQRVFISHGDCESDAQEVARMIREKFGTTDIVIDFIGPTAGAHAGPGTVALFFLGKER